jgi:hypothetical protein
MRENAVKELLSADAWTEYRTRLDLLGESPKSARVKEAREKMIRDSGIRAIVQELQDWPGKALSSHKSANQAFHKLAFLADIGMKADDPGMDQVISRIFKQFSLEGPPTLPMVIPKHFGGSGKEEHAWVLCDAPTTTYALAKMGLDQDKRILKSKDHLIALCKDFGFPCAASRELDSFKGPGKKMDPCPYASLIMLKLISLYPKEMGSDCSKCTVASLLNLWTKSRTEHPYVFYMGTDFRKLKAPFIWYDILHLLDTLSKFPDTHKDKRMKEMLEIVRKKQDANGMFTPESVWQAWSAYDFGQKKKPSTWMTFLVLRIFHTMGKN